MEVKGATNYHLPWLYLVLMSTIYIPKADMRMHDITKCEREGNSSLIATNITCTYYSLHKMACLWQLGMKNDVTGEIDTSCSYKPRHDESVQMYFTKQDTFYFKCGRHGFFLSPHCSDDHTTSISCEWLYPHDPASSFFSVMVRVVGLRSNKHTHTCSYVTDVLDIAKPAPVTNFRTVKRSGWLDVVWEVFNRSDPHLCILSYHSICTKTEFQMLQSLPNSSRFSIKLCNLQPNTNISLRVKCKYLQNNTEKGYWSEAVSTYQRTDPEIPWNIPNTTDGLYEVSEEAHVVTIYFTPLDECEMNDYSSKVVYSLKAPGKIENVQHPNYFAKIDVAIDEVTNITLRVINSVGMSNATETLTYFPKELVPRPSSLIVEYKEKRNDCFFQVEISQEDFSKKFSYLFHTVVWCPGDDTSCKGPLTWAFLEKNTTNTQIYRCSLFLRHGLITLGYHKGRKQLISGGIKWFQTLYIDDGMYEYTRRWFQTLFIDDVMYEYTRRWFQTLYNIHDVMYEDTMIPGIYFVAIVMFLILTLTYLLDRSKDTVGLLTDTRGTDYRKTKTEKFTWEKCINQMNASLAKSLLEKNIIPTNLELQHISAIFGRFSHTTQAVCAKICNRINQKLEHKSNVWPACIVFGRTIVFVVESITPLSDIQLDEFEIITKYNDNAIEKESQLIMLRERELLLSNKYEDGKFVELKQVILKKASKLMKKHKNINAICPSVVKSKGYDRINTHELIETPCISIYVKKKVKNLIPLEEEAIPAYIGDFPTDIVTESFSVYSNGPNDYHKIMKMGLAIHAGVRNDDNDLLGGTLGGFVQHLDTHIGLCCITSAHFMLSKDELQGLKPCEFKEYAESEGKRVFQPVGVHSEEFGRIHAAAYKDGANGSTGIEAVLIKIGKRKPTSGAFAKLRTEFDPVDDFVFNSGKVKNVKLLRLGTDVYKFGISTGSTMGNLGSQGAVFRDQNCGIELYNQFEIYPKPGSAFAQNGDSGALVFIDHSSPKSAAAIGILTGGVEKGKCFATPLLDVLKALNCPPFLNQFEDNADFGIDINMRYGAEGGCFEEPMDCN